MGKLLGVATIPLLTLVIPTILLWLVGVGIAPSSVRSDLWWLIVPTLSGALLAAAFLTSTLVGLSAHCLRAATVTAVFIAALALGSGFLEAIAAGPVEIAGYFAPERNVRTLVDWLCDPDTSITGQMAGFRSGHLNSSVLGSALAIVGYIVGGLYALRLRLRWEVVQ
jgi:hypothetical protein